MALLVNSALNIKTKNMAENKTEISIKAQRQTFTGDQVTRVDILNIVPVVAVKDDSGHWYVIPNELQEEFNELLNISIGEGPEAEDAETKFIEKFNQYMTGGDLNNVQLYAEI